MSVALRAPLALVIIVMAAACAKQDQPAPPVEQRAATPAPDDPAAPSVEAEPKTEPETNNEPEPEPKSGTETGVEPGTSDTGTAGTETGEPAEGETGTDETPPPPVDPATLGQPREVRFPIPKKLAACEREWLLAKAPAPEVTARCIEVFLEYGYGGKPGEYELDFDPYYGSEIELRYTRSQLRRMAALAEASCPPPDDHAMNRCERAVEFLSGMAWRKTELFDDVNVDGIEGALATILAGKPLGDDDLWLTHEGLGFSPLALWKLDAAIEARHGQPFVDEDLDAFFYSDRAENWDELGLPALAPKPKLEAITLSAADRHNRALIERAQAPNFDERVTKTRCYRGERVVFSCALDDGRTASPCGSETKRAPKLDWVVLRFGEGDTIPTGVIDDIDEVARFVQTDARTLVEVKTEIGGGAKIERIVAKDGVRTHSFWAEDEQDDKPGAIACTNTTHDALELVRDSLK